MLNTLRTALQYEIYQEGTVLQTVRGKWLLIIVYAVVTVCPVSRLLAQTAGGRFGVFQDHSDVGTVLHPGSVNYDPAKQTYTVTGSGENVWASSDAFQFAWNKTSGDIVLAADIFFPQSGKNPHRKAVLMIRQNLDADSAYADVAFHGSGLTSLQYRDEKGATTHEVQANVSAPKRVGIIKRGDYIYLFVAQDNKPVFSGASTRVRMQAPFYVGIGVCSHENDVSEKAIFSNVELTTPGAGEPTLFSTLETVEIDSTNRHVAYSSAARFEAPNWTRDGYFLFNRNGRLEKMPIAGGTPTAIDTGFATQCNNDHGVGPDGTQLAISDQSQGGNDESRVYIVPITGGTPRRITANAPSYWHGWSPDGKTLAFVGERNGEFDIYSIPAAGGEETRLTTAPGLDDGPEYSPDGKYIYFNSVRTGVMQIWRMHPDGAAQEQITSDDYNNWFPHISPDGKWMVFLTYEKDVSGHPEDKDVMLRLMSLDDHKVQVLAKLFGGQGTINVPSWAPDSAQLAFVSYHYVPQVSAAQQRH
jgi:TolB protein